MLDGEVTVKTEEGEIILKEYDSIYLAPDEARSILIHTNLPTTMPVAIRYRSRASSDSVSRERLPRPDGDDAHGGDPWRREGRAA